MYLRYPAELIWDGKGRNRSEDCLVMAKAVGVARAKWSRLFFFAKISQFSAGETRVTSGRSRLHF